MQIKATLLFLNNKTKIDRAPNSLQAANERQVWEGVSWRFVLGELSTNEAVDEGL
jgi:hypothetical protein